MNSTRNTAKAEAALRALQHAMRQPSRDERTAMTRELPPEYQADNGRSLSLLVTEARVLQQCKAALLGDIRFEYLDKEVDGVVWNFAVRAYFDKTSDHVPEFVTDNAHEPVETTCYIPIEYLRVDAETSALGITLLPVTDPRVPPAGFGFTLDRPVASIAAVRVVGTNYSLMADRARMQAQHALRLLRVALREHLGIDDHQLRFRAATAYAFAERHGGWERPPDTAYELEYGGELITVVEGQLVSELPFQVSTRLQKKAVLATQWLERALFATEPLVALLYTFFALEAVLGDKSAGLKAHSLVFRRAMLGQATGAGFVNPSETFLLYDRVRSAAVHGEDAPEVAWKDTKSFAWDVRRALSEYLSYAKAKGFTRPSQLIAALDTHVDRPQMILWLRINGGPDWSEYLNELDRS
jgi:hypothetical protein